MTLRALRLLMVLCVLIVLFGATACTSFNTWCDDHPVACPVVVTAGTACIAGAIGFIAVKGLHASASSSDSNSGHPMPPPVNPCAGNPACAT